MAEKSQISGDNLAICLGFAMRDCLAKSMCLFTCFRSLSFAVHTTSNLRYGCAAVVDVHIGQQHSHALTELL